MYSLADMQQIQGDRQRETDTWVQACAYGVGTHLSGEVDFNTRVDSSDARVLIDYVSGIDKTDVTHHYKHTHTHAQIHADRHAEGLAREHARAYGASTYLSGEVDFNTTVDSSDEWVLIDNVTLIHKTDVEQHYTPPCTHVHAHTHREHTHTHTHACTHTATCLSRTQFAKCPDMISG